MLRPYALIIALLALAMPAALFAQLPSTDPSAAEESFHIEPVGVPAGAKEFAIKIVANEKDLFAYNGKTPTLEFGTGVTLVSGSVKFTGSSEIDAKVNADADIVGAVPLFINFFAIDNENRVIKRARGHIGVLGPITLTTAQAVTPLEVSAGSVEHVQVNVETAQEVGDVLITGRFNGPITLETPLNIRFASGFDPEASVDGDGSAIGPAVSASRQLFSVTVANTRGDEITLRISNIVWDTSSYGGDDPTVSREYAMQVAGGVFVEAQLIVNAYSGGGTLEGNEIDQSEDTPPETAADTTSAAATSSGGNSGFSSPNRDSSGSGASNSSSGRNNNRRSVNRTNLSGQGGSSWNGRSYSGGQYNRGGRGGRRGNSSNNSGNSSNFGGGNASNLGGAAGQGARGGPTQSPGRAESDSEVIADESGTGESSADTGSIRDGALGKLKRSKRLYFADKDFKEVDGLVLQRLVRGEWRGRIWIVLERGKSNTPEVETVSITLKIDGLSRQIELTETGPETGIFRSADSGVELASAVGSDE